jgi:signal transduction histidine kinase
MAEVEYVRDKLAAVADPMFLLETLFVEAPVAFALYHADGHCVVTNRAFRELFGSVPPADYNVFKDELVLRQGLLPYVQRAFGGASVSVPAFWYDASKLEHVRVAGRRVAIEVSMTPLKDHDGTVRHVALCYKDVTAVHELEDERGLLRTLFEVAPEALAAMSHELRTPLNTIIGFTELLFYGRVAPDSVEHHEFLSDILASGRQLLHLINDVLDLAKVEAGKLELRPEPVVIESVIAEVTALLRTLSLRKRIRVQIEADHSLGVIMIDPARFKQVLYNYLANALQLTPEGGRIVVRTCLESDDSFRLEVEDSAVAPDPAERRPLDADHTAARMPRSDVHTVLATGLGLALTRRIVEAQGGTVGMRSHPGLGRVFHAVLPRATPVSAAR